MKLEHSDLDKRWYLYLAQDTFIHTENEWPQFFNRKAWNWITFHVCLLHFERDYAAPGWELEFRLLGLGFRIRHTFRDEWDRSELGRTVKEARDASE